MKVQLLATTLAAVLGSSTFGSPSLFAQASQPMSGVSQDVIDCKKLDGVESVACDLLMERINQKLAEANITIDRDGILYKLEDGRSEKIPTGHSCSVTAQVRGKSATARIGSDVDLDLSGNALDDPLLIKTEIPLSVAAQVRVKQRFGTRVLGSCSNYGSDSYTFKGSADTLAKLAMVFELSPSFGRTPEGNYKISINPEVTVAAELEDLDIDFSVSGVSPITPAWTFIAGFSSTLARATTSVFTGDSVRDVFEETAAFDFGAPIALSALSGPAGDVILDVLARKSERKARQKTQGFAFELEKSLNQKVRKALGISGSGEKTYLIDKDFIKTLLHGGDLDDIIVQPKVKYYCSWSYSWSSSRNGGGGLWGPDALGRRCNTALAGTSMRSGNTTYVCQRTAVSELSQPPQNFVLCE